jgi:hypothetical protein
VYPAFPPGMVAAKVPSRLGRIGVVAVTAAIALPVGACGEATLDSKAVKQQAETVQSIGSEGAILADQKARGRIKESFAQVEAADLAERAAKSDDELDPALATPELQDTVKQLGSLAQEASVQLRGLETDPRNTPRIRRLAERMGEVRDAASKVADEL